MPRLADRARRRTILGEPGGLQSIAIRESFVVTASISATSARSADEVADGADPARSPVDPPAGARGQGSSEIAIDASTHARLRAVADEHYEFVWRTLRRLGVRPPETDDATQQVFVVLAQKLHEVELGKERSFLFGTAARIAASTRRAQSRWTELPADDAPTFPAVDSNAELRLERAAARELLDAILASMSDERRVVLVLHELEELTIGEIAELLDLPFGTVASRLHRARQEFEAKLTRLRASGRGV